MGYRIKDDWNLKAALEYNSPGIDFVDISEVLAVVEGERDDSSWYWVLRLHDGSVGLLQGWCDYTGWDCQSGAQWDVSDYPENATGFANDDDAKRELLRQLQTGPVATRRQEVGEQLGLGGQ